MNTQTWKLTDAQTVVLHLVLSLLCSAVLAGLVAGYQLLVNNGRGFSVSEVWVVFASGFSVAFIKGLVPLRNNPKVVEQAALDTLSQIQAAHPQLVQQAMQQVLALFQQQQQQQQQAPVNVIIHPAVPVAVTQPQESQPSPQKPLAVIPSRPQPVVQQPVQQVANNPQAVPIVDLSQLNTTQTPVAPALGTIGDAIVGGVPQRSWTNSAVMPVVGGQAGQ